LILFDLSAVDPLSSSRDYHTNNGRFVDNIWKAGLAQENQGITYCGINAHWQNDIAKWRIRNLKQQARTMLLHVEHHWPEATSTSIWPYAFRTACTIFNDAPTLKGPNKDSTPFELVTRMRVSAKV
jgi:hypothetical protein